MKTMSCLELKLLAVTLFAATSKTWIIRTFSFLIPLDRWTAPETAEFFSSCERCGGRRRRNRSLWLLICVYGTWWLYDGVYYSRVSHGFSHLPFFDCIKNKNKHPPRLYLPLSCLAARFEDAFAWHTLKCRGISQLRAETQFQQFKSSE